MAAAAVEAAAARAAAVKANNRLFNNADKQRTEMMEHIQPLHKGDFRTFSKQLNRFAVTNSWHESILNTAATAYVAPADVNEPGHVKHLLDRKNAYLVILDKTDQHEVTHLLTNVSPGDGSAAYEIVYRHFHRATEAGRSAAYMDFHGSTMANTDVNIIQWISETRRKADILVKCGGEANDITQRTKLLAGLLSPQFDHIRQFLQRQANPTFEICVSEIMDFAQTESLTSLTKTGKHKHGANTFALESSSKGKAPCRAWTRFTCGYGDTCTFPHTGPGGVMSATDQAQFKLRMDKRRAERKSPKPPAAALLMDGTDDSASDDEAMTQSPYFQHVPAQTFKLDAQPTHRHAHPEALLAPDIQPTPGNTVSPAMRAQSADGDVGLPHSAQNRGFQLAAIVLFVSLCLELPKAPSVAMAILAYFSSLGDSAAVIKRTITSRHVQGCVLSVFGILALTYVVCYLLPIVPSASAATVSANCYTHSDLHPDGTSMWWCCDSGTNRFVTNDQADFLPGSIVHQSTSVNVGSGTCSSPMSGTILLRSNTHNRVIRCKNVLLMPHCSRKLLPISPFTARGCKLTIDSSVLLSDKKDRPMLSGTAHGGLFYFDCTAITDPSFSDCAFFGLPADKTRYSIASAEFPQRLLEAHWALGHLAFSKVRKYLGLKPGPDPTCTTCALAKNRTAPIPKLTQRSTRINHRMHMDIGFTRGSLTPFQLCVDDYTREGYLMMLDSKGDVLSGWVTLKTHLENKFAPWKFAFVKTDIEGVYNSSRWDAHCKEDGLEHEFSCRYRHDNNGVIERAMQTIGVGYRCMMIQGSAPDEDSPWALGHANIIRNNTPSKSNSGWSPLEKSMGVRLPLNPRLMKAPLFCLAYAHVYEAEGRLKHEPRGVACVYLGYLDTSNSYRVKEWTTGRIYFTGDLVFHPTTFPYRANPERLLRLTTQLDDLAPHVLSEARSVILPRPEPQIVIPRVGGNKIKIRYPSSGMKQTTANAMSKVAAETWRQNTQDRLDKAVADLHLNEHYVPNNVSLAADHHTLTTFISVPPTWGHAMESDYANDFIAARLVEQQSFRARDVYELVPRTDAAGRKIFKSKEVLNIKTNPSTPDEPYGSIDKFRYRLTIMAFTKLLVEGIDYQDKYASAVRWQSVLVLLAMAVKFDYDIALFDIKTFFLYGDLPDTVFMEQPLGWILDSTKPATDWIWKLKKSMYGLPQAAHCAQIKLNECITSGNHFRTTTADDCVHVSTGSHYAAIGAHVDDLPCVGTPAGIDTVRSTLLKSFEIVEKREPTIIMGVQLSRDRSTRTLTLHQSDFVAEILHTHGMTECNDSKTPISPTMTKQLEDLPTSEVDQVHLQLYQALVGALLWLAMRTRPDIMFCVNFLCRFLKCATKAHYNLARGRPLRYLKATMRMGLVFQPGQGEWKLTSSADADFAGDNIHSRSMAGHFSKLGEFGTISAHCFLERKVATSTGQAETHALLSLIKEVVWLRHLLYDLGHPQLAPTATHTDNRGVLLQSTKCINHTRSKHFRVAQAYIRSKAKDLTILVTDVVSKFNPSDLFTKPLHWPLFQRHRHEVMGPQGFHQ